MNVLFLSQANRIEDQSSYHASMLDVQTRGGIGHYLNIPLFGYAHANGYDALWKKIIHECRQNETDIVFFQFFHGQNAESAVECVRQLRQLPCRPLIAVSGGDLFSRWLRRPPDSFIELAGVADVTFLTAMGNCARFLASRGCRRLMMMPHAHSTTVFTLPDHAVLSARPEYEVVMVASRGRALNPFNVMSYASLKRQWIVDRLYQRYGKRFAVFGHGWMRHPAWQGPVPFSQQHLAFMRGRLVVDGRPPFEQMYYASDRPFYIAGSGIPLVQHYAPRFEKIFIANRNAYFIYDDSQVVSVCDRVLDMDTSTLEGRLNDTLRLVAERHTVHHRVEHMMLVCRRLRDAILTNRTQGLREEIPLSYFHPDTNPEVERPHALVNWE